MMPKKGELGNELKKEKAEETTVKNLYMVGEADEGY